MESNFDLGETRSLNHGVCFTFKIIKFHTSLKLIERRLKNRNHKKRCNNLIISKNQIVEVPPSTMEATDEREISFLTSLSYYPCI